VAGKDKFWQMPLSQQLNKNTKAGGGGATFVHYFLSL